MKAGTKLAAVAALVAACAAPPSASAALRGAGGAPRVTLPGEVAVASAQADPRGWIVGAQPGRAGARIARAHGAEHIAGGAWSTTRAGARALAADLRAPASCATRRPIATRRAPRRPRPTRSPPSRPGAAAS